MIGRIKTYILAVTIFSAMSPMAMAGVDLYGLVQRVQVAADGALWFAMDSTPASTYCKAGWNSLTMYVPANHPQYPYYFSILVTAASKSKNIVVANISVFNGGIPCDITQTGYGITLYQ